MIGSIIGDIVGSIYEFNNIKTTEFPLFGKGCDYTDDSILTIATADWLLNGGEVAKYYAKYADENPCPMGMYGSGFCMWVSRAVEGNYEPYNSCGNGSAMRVGPIGWAFDTIEDVMKYAELSAACTHNHPEGIKGAQVVAVAILMARQKKTKEEIKKYIESKFEYDLNFTCDEIRPIYEFEAICQTSVPQAVRAFLDSNSFEEAIRLAISIGGDSDTIGCITGSIAEAYYGVPNEIKEKAMSYLPEKYKQVVTAFELKYK